MLKDLKWEEKALAPTKPLEGWRQVLLDAADVLEKKGWCRDSMQRWDGAMCALGAISYADSGKVRWFSWYFRNDGRKAVAHLRGYLRLDDQGMGILKGTSTLVHWNDKIASNGAEVVRAMRAAATKE